MHKPSITILTLGGTIAMTQSTSAGVVPTLTGADLIAAVPALASIAHIQAHNFLQLPSAHLGYENLESLADTIQALADDGQDGIVITQGTDTIEETAFALDVLLDLDIPVVITGAMRNPTLPGADGPANLFAAVKVAGSPNARGCGCLVVMNDEVHAARFVQKTHTGRTDAFQSALCGRIGWIAEEQVFMGVVPPRKPALPRGSAARDVRIALATITLGDDGDIIKGLADAAPDGMIVAATGGGHVNPSVADALEQTARSMPVILASRTGAGNVLQKTYGYVGSEIDLQQRGLITAGWLDGLKAKVLLTLLLRHAQGDKTDITEAFRHWGGGKPD